MSREVDVEDVGARPRITVVGGHPTWVRLAVSIIAAAGTATLAYTAVFTAISPLDGQSPWLMLPLAASLLIFWAPLVWWAGWSVSVPATLIAGTAAALLTHRYRLADGSSRWRRARRICLALVLLCGAWSLAVGVVLLASVITG